MHLYCHDQIDITDIYISAGIYIIIIINYIIYINIIYYGILYTGIYIYDRINNRSVSYMIILFFHQQIKTFFSVILVGAIMPVLNYPPSSDFK